MSDPPPPPKVSLDGKFYWDGERWVPMPIASVVVPEEPTKLHTERTNIPAALLPGIESCNDCQLSHTEDGTLTVTPCDHHLTLIRSAQALKEGKIRMTSEWLLSLPKTATGVLTCLDCRRTHIIGDPCGYLAPCDLHKQKLSAAPSTARPTAMEIAAKSIRELEPTTWRNTPPPGKPPIARARKRKPPVLFYIRGPHLGPIRFPSTPVRSCCQSTLVIGVLGLSVAGFVVRASALALGVGH